MDVQSGIHLRWVGNSPSENDDDDDDDDDDDEVAEKKEWCNDK